MGESRSLQTPAPLISAHKKAPSVSRGAFMFGVVFGGLAFACVFVVWSG
jgi:hypothetical protein